MKRLAWLLAPLLAGCASPQNFMEPAGPAAAGLARLGWFALLLLLAVSVATWGLIFWVVLRRRGSFDEHAPPDAGGGQKWILVGGVALPVVVLSALFVGTLFTMGRYPMAHASITHDHEPDIRVIGRQWWFEAVYLPGGTLCTTEVSALGRPAAPTDAQRPDLVVHSPTEIHIPAGTPVEIELESHDVIHSFWVPKLHGKVDLIPGQKNRMRILADRPGMYEGQCAEYCGVQHAHMRLVVVAHTPEAYVRWLAHQRQAAVPPADAQVRAGQALFERAACALCHTVRGTRAHGSMGPDLTHVASRERIAGGSLPNTTANLEAWITDAQALKPGGAMPSLRQFTGAELRAVVAYLQSLR